MSIHHTERETGAWTAFPRCHRTIENLNITMFFSGFQNKIKKKKKKRRATNLCKTREFKLVICPLRQDEEFIKSSADAKKRSA